MSLVEDQVARVEVARRCTPHVGRLTQSFQVRQLLILLFGSLPQLLLLLELAVKVHRSPERKI